MTTKIESVDKPKHIDNNIIIDHSTQIDTTSSEVSSSRLQPNNGERPRRSLRALSDKQTSYVYRKLPDGSLTNLPPDYNKKKVDKPRWYNQTYLIYLALRQAGGGPLPRGELIKRTLEMDQYISVQRNLPPLFGGKVKYLINYGHTLSPSISLSIYMCATQRLKSCINFYLLIYSIF